MSIASVTTEHDTFTVPRQARTAALRPVTLPRQAPAPHEDPAEADRLASRYWQAVTRYLEDYTESPQDGTAYRSPARAAEAAARLRADADASAERALRAQRDARDAAGRLDAARTALEEAPAWQWRVRARLRAGAAREEQCRAAALDDLDEYSARMEFSLREARRAERIATVLQRSDRAHLAAADAAARTLGWRPGDPFPSRSALYVAGRDGAEPLPAIAQR